MVGLRWHHPPRLVVAQRGGELVPPTHFPQATQLATFSSTSVPGGPAERTCRPAPGTRCFSPHSSRSPLCPPTPSRPLPRRGGRPRRVHRPHRHPRDPVPVRRGPVVLPRARRRPCLDGQRVRALGLRQPGEPRSGPARVRLHPHVRQRSRRRPRLGVPHGRPHRHDARYFVQKRVDGPVDFAGVYRRAFTQAAQSNDPTTLKAALGSLTERGGRGAAVAVPQLRDWRAGVCDQTLCAVVVLDAAGHAGEAVPPPIRPAGGPGAPARQWPRASPTSTLKRCSRRRSRGPSPMFALRRSAPSPASPTGRPSPTCSVRRPTPTSAPGTRPSTCSNGGSAGASAYLPPRPVTNRGGRPHPWRSRPRLSQTGFSPRPSHACP